MSGERELLILNIVFVDGSRYEDIDIPVFQIGYSGLQRLIGGFPCNLGRLGQFDLYVIFYAIDDVQPVQSGFRSMRDRTQADRRKV